MSVDTHTGATPGPRVLRLVEDILLGAAVVSILAICGLIFAGVVTRAIFSWSLPDTEIFVRDLMIASIILPLASVAANRAHIAVDVFVSMMPDFAKAWSDLLSSVVGFLVLLPIAYGGWQGFSGAWTDGSYFYGEFEWPEWPGKFAFFLGYLVFVLRLLSLTIVDFLSAVRPSHAAQTATKEE